MKFYDCHIHSKHSHDGKSEISEYLKELDNRTDLEAIGITEHVDFDPHSLGYQKYDYSKLTEELVQARGKGYKVFKGAEVGFSEDSRAELLKHLQESEYDYVICSVHRKNKYSFSTSQTIELSENRELFRNSLDFYYKTIGDLLKEDFYNIVGHIGVYKRYLAQSYFDNSRIKGWLEEVELELANKCAKSNKIIEINTSGYGAICNDTFPSTGFLKNYYLQGGESVCLGSDAHSVQDLARDFNRAIHTLVEIGFRYITLPWGENKKIRIESK